MIPSSQLRLTCALVVSLVGNWALAAPPVEVTTDISPAKPAPSWVKMVELGEQDPALKGYSAPAGVKVEVVASEPQTIDPVGMIFDGAGRMLVLEWREGKGDLFPALQEFELAYQDGSKRKRYRNSKSVRDELKLLTDADGDGRYETARVLLNDLETPSSILLHDGWLYISGAAHVVRRRVLPDDKFGPPEEILRGFCGFNQHQVSGLTIGPDGWLYITSGDDDNFVEGSDGSRATTLRCGGVFRCRPDGSQVSVYALGFRNPYRDVVFDEFGNLFHADNDNEDGSKFQGCRLVHVLEGADYGWRLRPGVHCCQPDHSLGAIFGERPGRMPSMAKTGRGAPAGLTIYDGGHFPAAFQGLLLYPDVVQKSVRAYRLTRDGSTFAVGEQFDLLRSSDPMFRPVQAVVGPDGAIYLVDWRTNSTGPGWFWGDAKHGRIWRLSWSGTADMPAMALGSLAPATAPSLAAAPAVLANAASSRQAREAAAQVVLQDAALADRLAADNNTPAASRAALVSARSQMPTAENTKKLLTLLADEDVELARLAADLLGRNLPPDLVTDEVLGPLADHLTDKRPAMARASALALVNLAGRLPAADPRRRQLAERVWQALKQNDASDVFARDGLVRALEAFDASAEQPLLLAAFAAASPADPQAIEKAVGVLECYRSPQASGTLNKLLALAQPTTLTPEQWVRVLGTYRSLQADPAPDVAPIGAWLLAHKELPAEVQLAALESMALAGKTNEAAVLPVVLSILKTDNAQTRLAAIRVVGTYSLLGAAGPLVELLKDTNRSVDERRAIIETLAKLRPLQGFGVITSVDRGVEGQVAQLVAVASDGAAGPIRGDVLALLAQLDFGTARPLAEQWLSDPDAMLAVAAINVLGAKPELAAVVGQKFVDGKIDRKLLPQVAALLQQHAKTDKSNKLAELLAAVYKGALSVSTDPAELARVEQLVKTTGDPARGRRVYLDAARSQCIKCHGLEGTGGAIGPDLSKIWQTHTVGKILESILEPSKEIKENFQTFLVTTEKGQVYSGLRISANDTQVVLRNAEGQDIVIPRSDVEEMVDLKRSLMPDGVVAQLSFQEFVDLVAFLKDQAAQQSLRTTLTSAWVVAGAGDAVEPLVRSGKVDVLQPVKNSQGQSVAWQRVAGNGDARIEPASVTAGKAGPVYVLTYVHSPTAQTIGCRASAEGPWQLLCGQTALDGAAVTPANPVLKVPVVAGWNPLVIKLAGEHVKAGVQLTVSPEDPASEIRLAAEPN